MDIQLMVGKNVEVIANGMTYRGVLIEVSDADLNLKTPTQWISLPMAGVSSVRLAGQSRREPERDGILS